MIEIGKFLIGLNNLGCTKVYASENDMALLARLNVCLKRRLTVQFNGKIDDISALHKTIRRGVRPTTGYVDTHRRASPNNLIAINRHTR